MPIQNIRIPSLLGGVSKVSQSQRLPFELEACENGDINLVRGNDKRAGTEHIACSGSTDELAVVDPANVMHTFWIDRSSTEQWVAFIDPDATLDTDVIQIFSLADGTRATVKALDSSGSEVDLDDADADVAAMISYLTAGSNTARQRFRVVTVEDSSFILNREVETALAGTAITYRNTAGSTNVRQQTYDQNVTAWSDFDQPPSTTATYPTEATLIAGGNIDNDAIWFAVDDDIGLPQGFWWAISSTQPPWYQRLPTEGANSFFDKTTMPLRLAYDGSKFVLQFPGWTARYAGDSTTNPGPSFIGNALSDMSFHQGRFWFVTGERVVSSRAGDLFNLWINSTSLVTDADPIDEGVQGRKQSNIIFAESFRESLMLLTDASRQVELRANGPITPQSIQLFDSTHVYGVDYVEPVIKGAQLFFAGERDFSHILWQYDYSAQQVSNVAVDVTSRVHGYIPAEVHCMAASEAHDQLFLLTLADTDAIYVNKSVYSGGDLALNSWYRWTFPGVTDIVSCQVYDDYLYLVVTRNSLRYLERMALGQPQQDTDGTPAQTLSYAVRCDRKQKVQGVYDGGTNQTTWTLDFPDAEIDCVVLAPTWDTATVKAGGTEVHGYTVTTSSTQTTITIDGDYENNGDGDEAPAYIGLSFSHEMELSELFPRGEGNAPLHGNTKIMRGKIRHRDSGGYQIKITPNGRSEITKTYVPPVFGNTAIDGDQLDDFGEYQFKVMSDSRNLTLKIVNESPFPTAFVDAEFEATFIPQSFSPTR
jgi:hypothetical protein